MNTPLPRWLIQVAAIQLAWVLGAAFSMLHAEPDPTMVFYQGSQPIKVMDRASIWVPDAEDGAIDRSKLVSGQYDSRFAAIDRTQLISGVDNWIRFRVLNSAASSGDWVLDLHQMMLTDAELLVKNEKDLVQYRAGLQHRYQDWPLPHTHVAFPIRQQAYSTQTYYLKVKTPFQLYFAPQLLGELDFMARENTSKAFSYLFVGLLTGIFIYLILLSTGPDSGLHVWHFVWFVLFAALLICYSNGFLLPVLPEDHWFNTRLWLILQISLQVSAINVLRTYFQTRSRYKKIDIYFICCQIFSAGLMMLILFVSYPYLVKAELIFSAQVVAAMALISLYIWFLEREKVALFTIGNVGLAVTGAVSTYAALGQATTNDWIILHGYELGFCWQAIFFTWALTKKLNALSTEAAVAEAENRAKNEFIAKMSHEIRTPMSGVLGMVQLLHNTPVNEEQKHYLDVIDSAGKTLLSVINDILDYSRLMVGGVELAREPFRLKKLLSELNTLFTDVAHEKHLSFNIIMDEHIPDYVIGDSVRVHQILTNLLANAFKFTERGAVILKAKVADANSSNNNITICFLVKDTGIGIPREDQATLFNSFTQLDTQLVRRNGGTGLGLSICQQLTEMMGGTISVISNPGEGSEFTATILLERMAQDEQQDQINRDQFDNSTGAGLLSPGQTVSERPVLVAEDDQVLREVISSYLDKLGFAAITVSDGKKAVDAFVHQGPFAMVLMDCEMPVLGGISACEKIREYEKYNQLAPTPVFALTGNADQKTIARCEQAGMNGHLLKPVALSHLKELLLTS